MILTTEFRVSKESHSGSAPPHPFNKSKAENHHKANGCFFRNGFVGTLTMSDLSCAIDQAGETAAEVLPFNVVHRTAQWSEPSLAGFGITRAKAACEGVATDAAA